MSQASPGIRCQVLPVLILIEDPLTSEEGACYPKATDPPWLLCGSDPGGLEHDPAPWWGEPSPGAAVQAGRARLVEGLAGSRHVIIHALPGARNIRVTIPGHRIGFPAALTHLQTPGHQDTPGSPGASVRSPGPGCS